MEGRGETQERPMSRDVWRLTSSATGRDIAPIVPTVECHSDYLDVPNQNFHKKKVLKFHKKESVYKVIPESRSVLRKQKIEHNTKLPLWSPQQGSPHHQSQRMSHLACRTRDTNII